MVISSAYVLETESGKTRLPVCVATVGLYHDQETVVRPAGIDLYQMIFCMEGEGELMLGTQKILVSPGYGFYLGKNTPHSYRSLSGQWLIHCIGFDGNLCGNILESLSLNREGLFRIPEGLEIDERVREIWNAVSQNVQNLSYLSKLLYDLLLDLSEQVDYVELGALADTTGVIRDVYQYLEQNYVNAVSLQDISDSVHLSREYLCSYFKKETGITIMNALLNIRITHARIYLLQYPNRKVYEIAAMCGFADSGYFCRVFRKMEGMSPDAYRKRHVSVRE